ncbi:ubiquitin-conjugating enzyme [Piedraia hortae CBS 480.64]|uniref:Ubiquitin-conjugating enzyme E2 2 n=1 Tax=Piedraia hortae CBS 480.64 TaxID=1314780 RepID=A0A6A7C221_9PEZI|nr:ubiquitin-conjugating enzyme [Piedraia hortae CBS 480.64]
MTTSPGGSSSAGLLLRRQFQRMQKEDEIPGISCGMVDDDMFTWEIIMMLDEEQDRLYGGGMFKAHMKFPQSYPHSPPKLTFVTPIFHPNVYPNGEVCISILHEPGDDKYGYESADERWSPVQTPETILLSVISMLGSPNDESPANVEAGKLWREDRAAFRKRVRKCVRDSLEDGFE